MSQNILYPWKQETIIRHTQRLLWSYKYWTGKSLLGVDGTPEFIAQALWEAPFIVFSHGMESDPIYNYGNRKALELWEVDWEQLTQMPSRYSAESMEQEERLRILHEVTSNGYVSNVGGVRISRSGKRIQVSDFIIWNLLDENQQQCGQAATFKEWKYIQ
ncbi:MEKHLA domain-containing protein [Okeania sp. SIO1I7]|uniref:MEKHLA domain-containing protein n=1 Tax=Okeania sp. SIO1I7 TaxID=2607772 RepID=UPI0013F8455E|nr:MEKHLA domain-containing protein [Okeania sp. SIO1I7]NET24441.1 MEKHLA domain-containing protein [Okeania sp. SIO1I7]